jgi:long-chain acyl-CoA synthetase
MAGMDTATRTAQLPAPGTIGRLWEDALETPGHGPSFLAEAEGGWTATGRTEMARRVEDAAAGLLALGVGRGDRVAVLARTRVEWTLVDLAVASIGAILVPLYPSASAEECGHAVADSAARLLIVERERALRRVRSHPAVARLRTVLIDGESADALTLAELERRGRSLLVLQPDAVAEARAAVQPTDAVTYLYTSGTTGEPRACVLTHANFAAMVAAVRAVDGLVRPDDRVLLFLPLAHNFARLMQLVAIAEGLTLAYCRDFTRVPAALAAVRPTLLPSVPRLYERLQARIAAELDEARAPRRVLMSWALRVGSAAADRRAERRRLGPVLRAELLVADRLVGRRVRDLLGGRLRLAVSGGAPLPPDVARLFAAVGVEILEGYGLTEAICASHFNRPGHARPGWVGPPLPGIEARLAEDGEVLLRGETVFAGYLGDPEATAAVLDGDGWLHTGDLGEMGSDGALRIAGRKKDLIVTSGGKNISPARVERALAADPLVSQALVAGDGRPYLVALIAVDPDERARRGLDDEQVRGDVADAVARANAALGGHERVLRHALLPRELSVETGELTATLKVRRRVCLERYADDIDGLYDGRAGRA